MILVTFQEGEGLKDKGQQDPFVTSLVVRWLRLHSSNAGDGGLTPSQGTRIQHVKWHKENVK